MLSYIFSLYLELSLAMSGFILFFLYVIPKRFETYSPKCRAAILLIPALRLVFPIQPRTRLAAIKVTAPYYPAVFSGGSGSMTLMQVLAVIWTLGAAAVFFYHLIAHVFYLHYLEKGRKCTSLTVQEEEKIQQTFEKIKQELAVKRKVSLWISGTALGPVMLGIFRPVVVMPDYPMEEERLEMIFRHELMHWCRKDTWYRMIMLGAVSLHWFNPFVYILAERAETEIEAACDRSVIAGKDREFVNAYAGSLLETARELLNRKLPEKEVLTSALVDSRQKLKHRLEELYVPQRKKGFSLISLCMVSTLFGTGLFFVQENDQNLQWVQSLEHGNIAQVVMETVDPGEMQISMGRFSLDAAEMLSGFSFKPVFFQKEQEDEGQRLSITKSDGTEKTIQLYRSGIMKMDGQEYRVYDKLLK